MDPANRQRESEAMLANARAFLEANVAALPELEAAALTSEHARRAVGFYLLTRDTYERRN